MTKAPLPPTQEIRPGAVIGSESLPFESMIFSNEEEERTPIEITTGDSGQSSYVSGNPGRHAPAAPRPAISKLFRPQS